MRPLIYNKIFLLVIEMATSNIIKSFSSNLLVVLVKGALKFLVVRRPRYTEVLILTT